MGIRIIDRGKTAEILQERLAFFRSMVVNEMQQTQQSNLDIENSRIDAMRKKFDEVRSRLTVDTNVHKVAADIDHNIREMQLGALKAQTGLDIKKLLDLV